MIYKLFLNYIKGELIGKADFDEAKLEKAVKDCWDKEVDFGGRANHSKIDSLSVANGFVSGYKCRDWLLR